MLQANHVSLNCLCDFVLVVLEIFGYVFKGLICFGWSLENFVILFSCFGNIWLCL